MTNTTAHNFRYGHEKRCTPPLPAVSKQILLDITRPSDSWTFGTPKYHAWVLALKSYASNQLSPHL